MKKKTNSLVGREAALLRRVKIDPDVDGEGEGLQTWKVTDLVTIDSQTPSNLMVGSMFFGRGSDGGYYGREINTPKSKLCYRVRLSFNPDTIEEARKIENQRSELMGIRLDVENRYREWVKEPGPTAAALIVSRIGSGEEKELVRRLARLPQETLNQIVEVLNDPGFKAKPV